MRGGSIPIIAWGTLNLALLAINWIWEGTNIHVAEFSFAVLVIYLSGLALLLRDRRAVRRGPPEYEPAPEALPRVSFAAAGVGLAIGMALFGLVFANFLIYLGAALLLFCLLRLTQEKRWERHTLGTLERERRP